jgi:hypothetical protein
MEQIFSDAGSFTCPKDKNVGCWGLKSWVTSVVDRQDESIDQEKLPKIAKVVPQGETQPAPPQASGNTPSQPKEEVREETECRPPNGKVQEGGRVQVETPAALPAAPSISAICSGRSPAERIPGTAARSRREERRAGLNKTNIVKKLESLYFVNEIKCWAQSS